MNLRAIFENRSGRVIAALRAALAFVFLTSLVLEPVTAGESITGGLILIGGYLILSLVVAGLVWRDWWLDHRLATPLLVLDVAIFLGAVFITETADFDFTSPFLAFFALTVLSSSLRWDWQAAARTGAVVSILFVLFGFVVLKAGYPVDIYRFGRRAFYMVALLLVLVWFGIDRRGAQVPPLDADGDADRPAQLPLAALSFAMQATGATHGVLAWNDSDEPWIDLRELRAGHAPRHERLGPGLLEGWEALGDRARLFDLGRAHAMVSAEPGRVQPMTSAPPIPLADRAGITEGLALPLLCSSGEGLLVLGGIDGLGPDFLALGEATARQIEATIDRLTAFRLERSTAVMRARGAIARDLHDSVAQSLAGACFRLEALRRLLAVGKGSAEDYAAAQTEVAAIREALRREQAQVRGMIEGLRDPAGLIAPRPLVIDLERSLLDAADHWNLRATFRVEGECAITGHLGHELRQLLREAVANAARHGSASAITVALAAADGRLALEISDNGKGFGSASSTPWSIGERVAALGGQLRVHSGAEGTCLTISLPLAHRPEQVT